VKVLIVPFRVAVKSAEPLAPTAAGAFAVKLALMAPDPTVTKPGTLTAAFPLARVTLVFTATRPDRATVQVDVPGGVRVPGEHERLVRTAVGVGWLMTMAALLPVIAMELPLGSVPDAAVTLTGDDVLKVPAAI
jgi:hypothetical protein